MCSEMNGLDVDRGEDERSDIDNEEREGDARLGISFRRGQDEGGCADGESCVVLVEEEEGGVEFEHFRKREDEVSECRGRCGCDESDAASL